MYVFVHTVTLTYLNYEVSAQFYHAVAPQVGRIAFTLLGKRIAVSYRHGHASVHKARLLIAEQPNLRTLMKRRRATVRHSLRALTITPRNNFTTPPLLPQAFVKGEDPITPTAPAPPPINLTNPGAGGGSIGGGVVTTPSHPEGQVPATAAPLNHNHQEFNNVLTTCSTAEETVAWLTHNRFSAYLATFVSFSGADILRLTRDDLIQICGLADGIRLFNALHSKTIAPKLTLYICAEQSAVFNAVFLSAFSSGELAAKLAALVHVTADQVQGLYMQGPNAIHIHISDDVIRHFKNETMFSVDLIPEMGRCKIVLKPLTH